MAGRNYKKKLWNNMKSKLKKYKSKLEKSIEKKKELSEAEEYIRQVDKSDEEGRKYTIDKLKEEEKTEKIIRDDIKTSLENKKSQHFSYRRQLVDYGNWLIEEIKGDWEMEFVPTDGSRLKVYTKYFNTKEGIVLILKDPKQRVYMRAISTTYVPEYDEAGIRTLYIQAENTVDSYKGLLLSDKKKPIIT